MSKRNSMEYNKTITTRNKLVIDARVVIDALNVFSQRDRELSLVEIIPENANIHPSNKNRIIITWGDEEESTLTPNTKE